MQLVTALHRLRVVIEATEPIELHPFPGGELYALLAHAHGQGSGQEPGLPDGVSVEVIERGRARILPGQRWAFAITALLPTCEAQAALESIIAGLQRASQRALVQGAVIGGNFLLCQVEDLIAAEEWRPKTPLQGLDAIDLVRHGQRVLAQAGAITEEFETEVTLDWVGPLRIRHSGAAYSSRPYLKPGELHGRRLLHSVRKRWHALGFPSLTASNSGPKDSEQQDSEQQDSELQQAESFHEQDSSAIEVLKDHSELVRITYGPTHRRKFHGGILGRLKLRVRGAQALLQLWLGQHLGIGSGRRFSHGLYRLREFPLLAQAQPAASLRETALHPSVWSSIPCDSRCTTDTSAHRTHIARQWLDGVIAYGDPSTNTDPAPLHSAQEFSQEQSLRLKGAEHAPWRAIELALVQFMQPAAWRYRDDSGVGHLWHSISHRSRDQHGILPYEAIAAVVDWDVTAIHHRLSALFADTEWVDRVCEIWQAQSPARRRTSPLAELLCSVFPRECMTAARNIGAQIRRRKHEPVLFFRDESRAQQLKRDLLALRKDSECEELPADPVRQTDQRQNREVMPKQPFA